MLKNILTQNKSNFSDIINFKNKRLYKFNFSEENNELTPEIINSTNALSTYIDETLLKNDAEIGYGGYLEDRVLYKKSIHFGGDDQNSRTIHLGVDIWSKAGNLFLRHVMLLFIASKTTIILVIMELQSF